MPNYRRLFVPGGTYALTLALKDRRSDLLVRHIGTLRASWQDVLRTQPFETVAAVVMSDHLHLVMTLPEGCDDFPVRVRLLKPGFTRRFPEAVKSEGREGQRDVWQERYWEHAIRDADDLAAHVDYVHSNPVKHGFVGDPDDWPFSTWHRWKREYGVAWTPPQVEIYAGEP